jgi:hypothetical protein
MENRVYWYGLTQWQIGDRLREIGAAIVPIDRYAFLAAIVCGIIGSIYVVSRPIPPTHRPASRNQLRCGQYLIGAAAGATAIAVTTEIILTAWRLSETSWTTNSLLPLATIIGEAGIVSAAILYLRNTVLRTAAVLDQAVRPGTTQ